MSSELKASPAFHILVVEDNTADILLIRRAMRLSHPDAELKIVHDGEQAIGILDVYDADDTLPPPALVILDINLPRKRGGEVLQYLRRTRRCADIPVLVVSTSDAIKDREAMENLGANGYFRKPSEVAEFMKLGDRVRAMLVRPSQK